MAGSRMALGFLAARSREWSKVGRFAMFAVDFVVMAKDEVCRPGCQGNVSLASRYVEQG